MTFTTSYPVLRKICIAQKLHYEFPETSFTYRDGARFTETFQEWGVHAKLLLIGDPQRHTPVSPLLKLATWEQWCSPELWRREAYDVVMLYGGLDPRMARMMEAVKAGSPSTKVCLKMDTGRGPSTGLLLPTVQRIPRFYVRFRFEGMRRHLPATSLVKALALALREILPHRVRRIASLFTLPDVVLYEGDVACSDAKLWLKRIGRPNCISKVAMLGHPVRAVMACTGVEQRAPGSVVCIGTWLNPMKDPLLLERTIRHVLRHDRAATFTLVGKGSTALAERVHAKHPGDKGRVVGHDWIPNERLVPLLTRSQVFAATSLAESVNMAATEALCCGCSVALSTGRGVPSFSRFCQDDCGTQATSRRPADMAQAVLDELVAWRGGRRDPKRISGLWTMETHSPHLCRKLCAITGFDVPPGQQA